jgi:hypothetical protein
MATQYTAGITQGQVWTAAIANQIGAAYETFTPTWKFGTNTITTGFNYGAYYRINKLVIVFAGMSLSTWSGSGDLSLTLPSDCSLNPSRIFQRLGFGSYSDASLTQEYAIDAYHDSTSTTVFKFLALTPSWIVSTTVPFTAAGGDEFYCTLIGEKA